MQETTFPVEIVVHDDASTDGTKGIIKQYCQRYPRLFTPIFQQENQYSKGRRPGLLAFPSALGAFIATCEGDDYWTLPSKLQKQIEIFDQQSECILCGGRVSVIREGKETPYKIEPFQEPELLASIGPREMLKGEWSMRTVSRLAKSEVWSGYSTIVKNESVAFDYLFMLYCISVSRMKPGAFQCVDEVIGIYREHSTGVWFDKPIDQKISTSINILRFALDNFDFGRDINILEWVLLRNLLEQTDTLRGKAEYAKCHIFFFFRRNIRKAALLTKGIIKPLFR